MNKEERRQVELDLVKLQLVQVSAAYSRMAQQAVRAKAQEEALAARVAQVAKKKVLDQARPSARSKEERVPEIEAAAACRKVKLAAKAN